ncbi:MAG: hypothetical protein M3N16_02030 [Actinomycetota bacterium]|nr:hypothetical protein [Actinomycetota bacterium]
MLSIRARLAGPPAAVLPATDWVAPLARRGPGRLDEELRRLEAHPALVVHEGGYMPSTP